MNIATMKIINQKDNNNKSKKLKPLEIMQKINKIILIFRYDNLFFIIIFCIVFLYHRYSLEKFKNFIYLLFF